MHCSLQNPPRLCSQIAGVIFDFNQSNFIRDTCSKCSGRKYAKYMVDLRKMTAFDNTVQAFVPPHLVFKMDTCYASIQKRIGHNSHWSTMHEQLHFLEWHPSPCFAIRSRQDWTSAICLLWLIKGRHHATMLAFEDTKNSSRTSTVLLSRRLWVFKKIFFQKPSRKHRHDAHTVTAALLVWFVFEVMARKPVTCHQHLNSWYFSKHHLIDKYVL